MYMLNLTVFLQLYAKVTDPQSSSFGINHQPTISQARSYSIPHLLFALERV